ncbi:IctB family putative bicarbonate transporter [Calothrix sp. UHCC 0171]|uniref:IctB family putative bicarbonate transporter n=1 Tax=Calothrix sp. UHCC 0171 TaxID=3110245 RepID=UPI002B1F59D4|nr:IctB family putative bicarbonate transporter [Calothrix sp. UHCC 0171]MEA5571261.1 IctB family putative bicarbonate transporter [Calothrix sp. UHCC 0171]
MNLVWQRFTLSDFPLREYLATSYLHRSLFGLLRRWRETSILIQWGEIIAAALLSLLYGFAPFVANELIGLILLAGGAFWLLLSLADDTSDINSPSVTPIHITVFIFWGVAFLATALSPVRKFAITDFRNFTLYLLLFALCARVLKSPRLRSWILTLYMHAGLIVSVYGVRQKLFGAAQLATWVDPESPLSKNTRVYSYLGNPNLLAGYLLPAVVLSLIAVFAWKGLARKCLATTMLIVNLACFRFADSRGSFIGLALALVVVVLLLRYWYKDVLPRFWRTWLIPILLGSFVALFAIAFGASETFQLRIKSIFAGRGDSSNNFRMNVWTAVFQMIRDRPIFGIGPGHNSFNNVYPLYQIPRFTALSAYSIILEITVEMGFVGLSSFIWLLMVTFNTGLIQLQRFYQQRSVEGLWMIGAITSLVAMLGHGLVDTVWYRPQINTLWWMMVGLVASYWTPPSSDDNRDTISSDPQITTS